MSCTLIYSSLLSENRFLRESLEHTKEEKELANEMGRRYKKALEQNTKNPEVGLKEAEEDEIKTLIRQTSFPCPSQLDLNSAQSLRELATSLLETLNERMLQLKHQRRANKHLMDRIAQVETKIKEDCGQDDPDAAQRVLWPSQYLMKDYSPLSIVNEKLDLMMDQDVVSPDIADLHKRFDAILNCKESVSREDPEENGDEDLELPEHLQKLVDQALALSETD